MNNNIYHEKEKMNWFSVIFCLIVLLVFLFSVVPSIKADSLDQQGFDSPEEAVKSLVEAVRMYDLKRMLLVLGPESRDLISSGDEASDRTDREKFLEAYKEMNTLTQKSADTMILCVGIDNWPMPIPLAKRGSRWYFDTQKGRQEILNRRIGRNELSVIDVLHAFVEAQHEYASKDCAGSGKVEFAQKIISTEGKHDGLYWDAKECEESPLGPLIAHAAEEGYANPNLQPFHGYYFKILKGQGKYADGGAYDYVVKGKMILGFAIIAFPAEYGNSGVMTFMVNQQGIIYQKNLGKNTKRKAEAIKIFDPDKTWTKVEKSES